MEESPWYVLHVIANHEKKVAQHLAVRSLEHYLPLFTQRSRWTDRYVTLERPLFAGYIFARFPSEARFSALTAPGVLRMLGESRRDTVSATEIDRIREGLQRNYRLLPHPYVTVGTPVRVRSGVFEGVEGIVSELRQQCRVVIALAAVQQCFSLEADPADLEVLRVANAGNAEPETRQLAFSGA
jgi:transcription antitermination factor NusG